MAATLQPIDSQVHVYDVATATWTQPPVSTPRPAGLATSGAQHGVHRLASATLHSRLADQCLTSFVLFSGGMYLYTQLASLFVPAILHCKLRLCSANKVAQTAPFPALP